MRYLLIAFLMLLGSATSAVAQFSIGIGFPGVSIGINLPVYPELVRVPGYPVYYAPRLNSNYFFYDGMYWVYQDDSWYASSWYNGPWGQVAPESVPLYVLRIPVRYYRAPPVYFGGWRADAPPRWGEHWGNDWQHRRSGWDRWDRRSTPAAAPLPTYQRRFSGDRYPQADQQRALQGQNYRREPRDNVVRQIYREQTVPGVRSPSRRKSESADPSSPRARPPQSRDANVQRAAPNQAPPRQSRSADQDQRPQPAPGREKKRDKEEERAQERNK